VLDGIPVENDKSLAARIEGKLRLSGYAVCDVIVREKSIESDHLVVTCSLTIDTQLEDVRNMALIDCGATGYAFVDE
jgi:hypothetical protein